MNKLTLKYNIYLYININIMYKTLQKVEKIINEIDDDYSYNYADINSSMKFKREFFYNEINNKIRDLINKEILDNDLINELYNYIDAELKE